MNDKVMIAIPIYDGAYEYLDEFIAGLRAIDYDNFDVMFSVNGNSKKIVKKIKELMPTLDFLWSIHETKKGKDAHQSIYNSMKQLRKVFLGVGDYDWMLVLEADIVPYPDILKEFVEARYPVMGCPYKLSDKMMMINIFTPWGRNENIKIKDYNSNYINQLYVRVWSCGFG